MLTDTKGESRSIPLNSPVDFSQRENLKTFSGTAFYKIITISGSGKQKYLQPGETHWVAGAAVNGKKVATLVVWSACVLNF